ncbi:MAG: hypothetical protein JNL10_04635 [Verrucomicrobiales bacterium]|nr:hypothetical protein [Verrucomicrobiales bacterium]
MQNLRPPLALLIPVLTVVPFPIVAETVIATFDDFNLDGLFAWSDAVVDSGPESYSITDSGYGSGFKNINPNLDASGETTLELTVTLSGDVPAGTPVSGPIVSLVDADGTFANYAWYGRSIGRRILKVALNSPTSISNPGTVPGLDLSSLDFFHLQDDPGAYKGTYTITFEHLRLIGAPAPTISSFQFDPGTQELALTWTSRPGRTYSILYASVLSGPFNALSANLESGGTETSASVPLPEGDAGWVAIQEE